MSAPFHILVVCTGNICRSPAAERLLRAAFQPASPADAQFRITSAGTYAMVGWPIDPPTAEALRWRRIDPGGHQARSLLAAEIADADLVLTATREHRAAGVLLYPKAVRYAYTLREFARLAASVVGQPGYAQQPPHALLAEVRAQRGQLRPADPLNDDIGDPYGLSGAEHSATVAEIAAATDVIAGALSRVAAPR